MTVLALTAADTTFVAPTFLFWLVVIAASLCAVAALVLSTVAWRRDLAELGYLGAFFMAVSVLPLVHGITVPGILYDANTATVASVYWAVPFGFVALAPLALRRRPIGRAIGARWRLWWAANVAVLTALSATMLAAPNLIPFPDMGTTTARVTTIGFYALAVAAALRQARLSRIAQRPGPAVLAFAFILVGSSSLVFLNPGPWTPHFWLAHAVDIGGVFLGTIGGAIVYRREGTAQAVFSPVFAVDPHAALEVGLSPVVHDFVADLDAKDAMTRDHVVRTAELAVDCARELGLGCEEIREVGLVALMHDIGKIAVPDEILTKPGRLTEAEFEVMKGHARAGEDMVAASPGLESIAASVGAHHERFDGAGYPRGLSGDEIPQAARICAACDAFDAMSATRHYRDGMDPDVVRGILEEHAGAQWDPAAVDALLRVVGGAPWTPTPRTALRDTGRIEHGTDAHFGCDCVPDLPEPVKA
ncbi:MAG: HD domain-containing phosphohydrolase [Actinomycetota bacterium]